ncbi:response regulator transcription factor [Saccharicrinis sp. FJH2]|uniref:response regulator transcription factor n=1 Tax=Saccharicrinis sp. FJH65 TaxID=3344659 RepID=UPI0035F26F17
MQILLIEDDLTIASFIQKGLQKEGFSVVHTLDGNSGYELALNNSFDIAIVDIMLPGLDGFSLIKQLRAKNNHTPIIILSAKGKTEDRVNGLNFGADDYLVKPFAFAELLARINAIMKRRSRPEDVLCYEGICLDISKRKVARDGININLQPLDFDLLRYLLEHQGNIVSRTMIIENVWDFNFDPQTNVVDVRICRLREKLDKPFEKKLIHTIKGAGYVLEKK